MTAMSRAADLMLLNLFFLFTSIPIVNNLHCFLFQTAAAPLYSHGHTFLCQILF